MANIDLNVTPGQTKTLTFNTKDKYNTENIVFSLTSTQGNATQTAAGLMSATDKTKLDGIASGANAYVHPTGDGNLHVPATGTANKGKVLTAGATAGSLSWTTPLSIGTSATTAAAGNHTHSGYAASSHNHSWSNITSGLPTTISGYGITDSNTFVSGSYSSGILNVSDVPSGKRSYTRFNGNISNGIKFTFTENNVGTEHYLLVKSTIEVRLSRVSFSTISSANLIKPVDLDITVNVNQYIEFAFIPISNTEVIMTVSDVMA